MPGRSAAWPGAGPGRGTSRWSRAVRAVVLAVALLTAGLPVPAAVAADTPTPGQSEVAGEFADIARELLKSPIGRAGIEAHEKLNMTDGARNLAVIWFDLTDIRPFHLEAITREFSEETSKTSGRYVGYGRLLRREGNEALFDEIGIAGDGPLFEFAAVNDPGWQHSESVIYDTILNTVLGTLGLRAKAIDQLKGKAIAGYSDRGRCGPCEKLTSSIPEKNFKSGTPYETSQDRKASANRVAAITSQSISQLKRERKEKEKQAKAALPVPGSQAGTTCTSMGSGSGRYVMAMPQHRASGPCGGADGDARPGALDQALAPPGTTYGGVDFSTLEMRYFSDGSDGVQYAYSAQPLPDGYQQDPGLGARMVENLGDDLRTWLVLDPQKFWVNLNPTEPDRIVDPALGETNAGKAMLEADLRMKRTEAKILHPDTETGARYWQQIRPGADGSLCFSGRMWIVPGQVEVREDGGSLQILKALLDVKTKSEHIDDPASQACTADPATEARNEELHHTLVLPEVVKAVNTAPEYAPLRRAFMARIIAQWVRERHQQGHRTSFDKIIGSGQLGPARLDGDWRPKQVFDDYVRSYRDKEFDITRETTDGGVRRLTRFVYGGADLTKVRLTAVSAAEAGQRYPRLTRAAQDSAAKAVTAPDGSIWLGGTVRAPEQGLWAGLMDDAARLTGGNGPWLAVLLLALVGVLFGFRSRRGGRTPGPA
ncbi:MULTISPECIES: hypothetical protein [unclassified Streptomyces]|uniref:hypothetical protein n=1 Tax=unclassified Streptomyces TaxID=2593676 RepID=UPI0004CA8490|nr:hypothetical protein [Streptomyces sp. NRRL F-2747]